MSNTTVTSDNTVFETAANFSEPVQTTNGSSFVSDTTDTISSFFASFQDTFSAAYNNSRIYVSEKANTLTASETYQQVSTFANDYGFVLNYAGALTGGAIATDAAINLIQDKARNKVEVIKTVLGAGLVAASAYTADNKPYIAIATLVASAGAAGVSAVKQGLVNLPPLPSFRLKTAQTA